MPVRECASDILRSLVLLAVACVVASATTPTVTTVAGGYVGDGKPATSASFAQPISVARDTRGNLYVSDSLHCRIRKVDASGTISTFAGTGICGYSGDGGPATSAMISAPNGIAVDLHGNVLFADQGNNRIREITLVGVITTVAGNGTIGYSGDGGPAVKASLSAPSGIAIDQASNLYIADSNNYVIRLVDKAGMIHTVAGNHVYGFSGDGGPATSAQLTYPNSVLTDRNGNFYISDTGNDRVRKVDSLGTITTYAGNGSLGNTGSGGLATGAALGGTSGLLLAGADLYISTGSNIWAVNLSTQIINIMAGDADGATGFNGDGNSATATTFSGLSGMVADGSGGLFVADSGNERVRHIAGSTQLVSTIAGGYIGDGGKATAASLTLASVVAHPAFDPAGNLYIPDVGDCRIRKVSPAGAISTFAGSGICGYSGDGGLATSAMLSYPQAVAADDSGNVYIADTGNEVIRKVDHTGTISTFVQFLTTSTATEMARVPGLAIDAIGNLYVSDGACSVWKVTPSGSTTVVAGVLFNPGYNGDGIPATEAWLSFPTGVAFDNAGNLYISDWNNQRIRKVDTNGIISTVAGNGIDGFGGDGGLATSAMINLPSDVAADTSGNLYIADWLNFRVRTVNRLGIIQTLAGTGNIGYNGDGLHARQTNLFPNGLVVWNGVVYVSDEDSYRVRRIH